MAASTKLRLIADENDLQAVRTDPSGFLYAVLQMLRDPDNFGEADFAALIERGKQVFQTQGGMLRHSQDVRDREMAPQIQDIRTGRPKAKAIGKPKAKRRTQPADAVTYAGTDEEDERMAEARRLQATLAQPEDYDVDEDDVIEVDEERITLTNPQLQALLRNVALKAIAEAQQAVPAEDQDDDEDDEDDDDEGGDPEEEEVNAVDAVPPTPGEPQPEAEETRGRDDSGRFVTKK